MPHSRFPARRRDHQQILREKVETEDNIGKIISIDIETGDYEIDVASDDMPLVLVQSKS